MLISLNHLGSQEMPAADLFFPTQGAGHAKNTGSTVGE